MTGKKTSYDRQVLRKILRPFFWFPVLALIAFLVSFSVFQVPKIQTKFLNEVSEYVAEGTSFSIDIDHANLTWYDRMRLEQIEVRSKTNDSLLFSIENVRIKLDFSDLVLQGKITARALELEYPYVHVLKTDSIHVNISVFLAELRQALQSNKKKKSPINLDQVTIKNGTFKYDDLTGSREPTHKFMHFGWDSIQAELLDFRIFYDSINFHFTELSGKDFRNKLNIKSATGIFDYCKSSMIIHQFKLKTNQSTISDSVAFFYQKPTGFRHFNDSVLFAGRITPSNISIKELEYVLSADLKLDQEYFDFKGNISGSTRRLVVNNFDIGLGEQTNFRGNVALRGLPYLDETFVNLNLNNSQLNFEEIQFLIPEKYREQFTNLGVMELDGEFLGFSSDFVANGVFNADSTTILTDVRFSIDKMNKAHYEGHINLRNFDLRNLFPNQNTLQHISLDGNINGSGLRKNNADFSLDAKISSLSANDYTYSDLYTDGKFSERFFKGRLSVNDSNFVFKGDLEVDLRKDKNQFRIDASIDSANLYALNLTNQELKVSSIIDVDMKGLDIDEIRGYLHLYQNKVTFQNKLLTIDSIKFISTKIGPERIVHLETEGLTGELKGAFDNSKLVSDAATLYQEVLLNLKNDSKELNDYYANKDTSEIDPYSVDLELNLWNLNKFVQPFYPQFNLARNVRFEGKFAMDTTANFTIFTSIDTIGWDELKLCRNDFFLELGKSNSSPSTLASLNLYSENQYYKQQETQNFWLDAMWQQDTIYFGSNINQEKFDNLVNVQGTLAFLQDTIKTHFYPSEIRFFDKNWEWNPENVISIFDSKIQFNDVSLNNENEQLRLHGTYGEQPNEILSLGIREFGIHNLGSLLNMNLDGVVDGKIRINKQRHKDLVESDLIGRAFKIDNFLVGNVFCLSEWENDEERLAVQFDVVRNDQKNIEVEGFFYPFQSHAQLDLNAVFNNADLKIVEPFFKKRISNLSGFASGSFHIGGNVVHPQLKGKGQIENGSLTIDYLNTTYRFHGGINFDENKIFANNIELTDSENNQAIINGSVSHNGFKNIALDVRAVFDRFKLLNTTAVDNSIYYGTAYGSGEIRFIGDINDLKINANVKSEKGTRISIPTSAYSQYSLEQKDYINFVNFRDPDFQEKKKQNSSKEVKKVKGLQMDFDIEMTEDAYVELIFDVKVGDIIRGRGNGNISLNINTDGDFTMFGDYNIQDGGYNFTLYNLISKEFKIQQGSTISWFGDPYGARLNILAKYRQLAALYPILSVTNANDLNSPEARKKYPAIVDLKLTGPLLTPNIKFDIDVEDYPIDITLTNGGSIPLANEIAAFRSRIQASEQEMNRQVFSLIILRKFSPENSFQVNSQTIGNSLSEFASNQLSYWASQVDENLEIDVDLAGLDEEAFNTFQLRLSYTFMDGRLRVSRGGGLPNDQTKDDISAIIGDWTVEYLLTEDGRYRVKMYSRSDLNSVSQNTNQSSLEAGFSLQFIRSFDELKQILSDSRNKNRKKQSSPQPDLSSAGTQ